MYPNLYYFFRDNFGISLAPLRFINSFGFFVAMAFVTAASLLSMELKRKGRQGLVLPEEIKTEVGKSATTTELILNFILGFLLGYKILALFFLSSRDTVDPQAYIFSGMGSFPLGILTGIILAGLKWWEKRKQRLANPEQRIVRIWPHDRVGEITVFALVFGLLGAKLFDIFENWGDFLREPTSYLFSGGGLTFYGGLICAALAIIVFAKNHKIPLRQLADAIAPSLMIAYAIGRIGCQVAGDGDWGVFNSAFKVSPDQKIVEAGPSDFRDTVAAHYADFFVRNPNITSAPQLAISKPKALFFLPNWFFAYNYPHNVNETGVAIPGCEGRFCKSLPIPVFPTPFYETVICFLLFLALWALRKKLKPAGVLFSLYLIVNGIERFFIEKIRVNNRIGWLSFHPTQAEVISFGLIFLGAGLWVFFALKYRTKPT